MLRESNWTSKKPLAAEGNVRQKKSTSLHSYVQGVYSVCIHAFHQMKAWLRFVEIRNNALRVPRFPSASLPPKCFTILLIASPPHLYMFIALTLTSLPKKGSFSTRNSTAVPECFFENALHNFSAYLSSVPTSCLYCISTVALLVAKQQMQRHLVQIFRTSWHPSLCTKRKWRTTVNYSDLSNALRGLCMSDCYSN